MFTLLGHPSQSKLFALMRDRGDNCGLCGREFQHLDATVIIRRGQKFRLVGECCAKQVERWGRRCLGGSVYINPSRRGVPQ